MSEHSLFNSYHDVVSYQYQITHAISFTDRPQLITHTPRDLLITVPEIY